jgi:hypothetical protein
MVGKCCAGPGDPDTFQKFAAAGIVPRAFLLRVLLV